MTAAARMREQVKAAGYGARQVSVRLGRGGYDTSIRITIRSLDVDPTVVRRLSADAEHVARCEVSGEILAGGNTYVRVEWADGLLEAYAAEVVAALEAGETVDWNGWRAEPDAEAGYFVARRLVPRLGERADDVSCWGADFCARQVAERVLVERARAGERLTVARQALAMEAQTLSYAQDELSAALAADDVDAEQVRAAAKLVQERAGLVRDAAAAVARAEGTASALRRVA